MAESGNVSKQRSTSAFRGAGLILWKGGLWVVAGYILYESIDYSLGLLVKMGIPLPPRSGIVLVIAGIVLVVLSMVLERIHAGKQNNLKDP